VTTSARPLGKAHRRVLCAAVLLAGCRAQVPAITEPLTDDFERAELGPQWHDTGAGYRIRDGRLNVSQAYNHPLWLRRRLPDDFVLEVDAMSKSPAGDLKVEIAGDGESFDPDRGSYVSTGYMFIFGGWHNSLSVICRNNEHDDGRKVGRASPPVEVGRTYHWTITRKGGALDWKIDGQPFLAWTDPDPLRGRGHEFFGINNWEADVHFDNLRIAPLP
jgi:hypothetical protein